jgi:uncharacterized protein involved in oxidation of intracellular sulfur
MITFIVNDAPYGDERPYNAFRLASALAKKDEDVRVFFFADAVFCGKRDQKTPDGYYNIERMIKGLLRKGGKVYA